MKIIVLNGSPKGEQSVTMQYINYLQKRFAQHEIKQIHVAYKINQILKDEKVFDEIITEIEACDGVIWGFPLYILHVCSQYKRFIELINERNAQSAFEGKYAAILATSVNFYDHTAINYVSSICEDFNMKLVDSFSAKMYDLDKADRRMNFMNFARIFFDAIENKRATFKMYNPIKYSPIEYQPTTIKNKVDINDKRVVVLADNLENVNLKNMVNSFKASFTGDVEVLKLEDVDIKGGCLGCLKCGYDYKCAYSGKDGFIDFYNSKLKNADIIVYAGAIIDRYLSWEWKRFFDRTFFNTHTPSLKDKQFGFIIAGPLRQIPNLVEIFDGYVQFQMANGAGYVTDDANTSIEIDAQLNELANKLVTMSNLGYKKPMNFLGVSGWKIFRDEMWGELRFPFIADYKAYKALGIYDFPQKNYRVRAINFVMGLLTKKKSIRDEIYSNQIKSNMVSTLQKVIADPSL